MTKARSAWQVARAVAALHPDSAANRAYYAVHHALRWRYGGDLPGGHFGAWSEAVTAACGLHRREGDRISRLYRWRLIADYSHRTHLSRAEAHAAVGIAHALLRRLGIRVG